MKKKRIERDLQLLKAQQEDIFIRLARRNAERKIDKNIPGEYQQSKHWTLNRGMDIW